MQLAIRIDPLDVSMPSITTAIELQNGVEAASPHYSAGGPPSVWPYVVSFMWASACIKSVLQPDRFPCL